MHAFVNYAGFRWEGHILLLASGLFSALSLESKDSDWTGYWS